MNTLTTVNPSNTRVEDNNISFNSKKKKIEKVLSNKLEKKIAVENSEKIQQDNKPVLTTSHKTTSSETTTNKKISCFTRLKSKLCCGSRRNNVYFDDQSIENTNNKQNSNKHVEPIYYELEPPATTQQTTLYSVSVLVKHNAPQNSQPTKERIYDEVSLE